MTLIDNLLSNLGFVHLAGGPVRLGTDRPLPCRFEGFRRNETPVRELLVGPFWIARCCVTNAEFERFKPQHRRPLTSPLDGHPVTDVTYLEALDFAAAAASRLGVAAALPTEAQWLFAAAPYGLEFPWGDEPDRSRCRTRGPGVAGPLEAADASLGLNWCGLCHIVGNVQQLTLGHYAAPGSLGAASDGAYCIVKGGDWKLCKHSAGVQRRGLADVAGRAPTVGFRLVVNL
ncbi:MAG: SUMF1/EgtB/PvdO family nonheme iron enzyme [Patescibacteria group bacterium]